VPSHNLSTTSSVCHDHRKAFRGALLFLSALSRPKGSAARLTVGIGYILLPYRRLAGILYIHPALPPDLSNSNSTPILLREWRIEILFTHGERCCDILHRRRISRVPPTSSALHYPSAARVRC
ncbi:hypothetical protein B0H16DRAFT_1887993, partial [Mycena metata]